MNGSGLTGTGNSSANTLITLGANTLVGGDGNDTFEFFAGSANGATVADFDRSEGDVLVFSGFGTEAQGATFSPDHHSRPVADPLQHRWPQRGHYAREPRRAGYRGFPLCVRSASRIWLRAQEPAP